MQKKYFDNKQFKDLGLFACDSLVILPLRLIYSSEIMFLGFVPNCLILLFNVGYVLTQYFTSQGREVKGSFLGGKSKGH